MGHDSMEHGNNSMWIYDNIGNNCIICQNNENEIEALAAE